jgi:hypothetical protein
VPTVNILVATASSENVSVSATQNDSGIGVSVGEGSFPVTVTVEIGDVGGVNPYKLVALLNGTIIGGSYDPATGLFTFEVSVAGNYEIAYVENLNRLSVQIGSTTIADLAGNVSIEADVPATIVDGRTLVPLRFIANALAADVAWNDSTKEVTLSLDGRIIVIPIGAATPELTALGMEVPAQIIDGRTMVPLRFIGEFFGAVVTWDEVTRSIEIIK